MKKEQFDKILSKTKNQLLVYIGEECYFLNISKTTSTNELGIIAINERTGLASIVFFDDIESVISDGQIYESN